MKKNVAFMGLFLALALVLSYVETLIPISFGIPGVKLGLTNIVVVLVLYGIGTREAYVISVLRILLAGFLFGNLFGIFYSLAGGLLSLTCMAIMKRAFGFSMVSVSIVGGITHNLGQIIIASLIVENYSVMYYFPVLFIAGAITGVVIGMICYALYKRLRRFFVEPRSNSQYIKRPREERGSEAGRALSIKNILFAAVALGAGLTLYFVVKPLLSVSGSEFRILVDGETYGEYSLDEDQEIEVVVDGKVTNIVTVKDKKADMTDADCPDKLCVMQKAISNENESIICLPNKVVVEVTKSEEKSEYDSIAR